GRSGEKTGALSDDIVKRKSKPSYGQVEIDSTTEGENPFLFYVERVSKDPLRWSDRQERTLSD
ncbi:hypothetical protein MKC73_20675, partial [[Clostridium] innocuum]|nr:hypothetical protein [[Clostridium] innocuum]